MCLAIPARIVQLKPEPASAEIRYAKVELMGNNIEVNVQLLDQPEIGDYVLIHAGCAIKKIDLQYFTFLNNIYYHWLEEC